MPTKPAYVMLLPITFVGVEELELTYSKTTIILLKICDPQSKVLKCIIRSRGWRSDFESTRTPPLVQHINESSKTLNATRDLKLAPETLAIPFTSSISSWEYKRRINRNAQFLNKNLSIGFLIHSWIVLSSSAGKPHKCSLKSFAICSYRFEGGRERSMVYVGISPREAIMEFERRDDIVSRIGDRNEFNIWQDSQGARYILINKYKINEENGEYIGAEFFGCSVFSDIIYKQKS